MEDKNMPSIHVDKVDAAHFADRWSKNLVGTDQVPTQAGFNLGIAEYHAKSFEPTNVQ
jgi:hypothetical protein